MGYRSDVAIVLSKDAITEFNNELAKAEPEIAADAKNLMDNADDIQIDDATGAKMWLWKSVKWSLSYKDCLLIENILDHFRTEKYLFYRIGEEYTDVVTEGSYPETPFNIEIVRYINVTPKNN